MTSLLPGNSGLFEKSFEASLTARWTALSEGVDAIRYDKLSPPVTMLAYAIWEFGLGELTPYMPNLYDLLREGIIWQRARGTRKAMDIGLGWIGYAADIHEAWHGRRWWNAYQLYFSDLPAPNTLERIEGIARLSTAKRSQFRRGVHGYDVPACELDGSQPDGCLLDRESGVVATQAGIIWSFGRKAEVEHWLTETEGLSLGNWVPTAREPVAFGFGDLAVEQLRDDDALLWANITIPWSSATFLWATDAASQRQAQLAAWFAARPIHLVLRAATGGVIGYRRCRIVRAVTEAVGGPYSFRDVSYAPASGGRYVYIEAMTDFENADGVTAAAVSLLVGASAAEGIPPGRLWLQPGDLTGGVEIASNPVSLPLRATVREQITYLMRF